MVNTRVTLGYDIIFDMEHAVLRLFIPCSPQIVLVSVTFYAVCHCADSFPGLLVSYNVSYFACTLYFGCICALLFL